ncbi:hypothetical protein JAAARDRAFT_55041 [Jaapia argillacea MUCL 33604]|uniref:Uncharacterized protein n=1 Tax=Jaapia argillacea MUCL 33604 TaxID=933084 RepID=A0A067Q3Z5_9AGAM|nr:hypothetical protein JAAARDRAFT_55041 [Jaapia argillacea MUCL 33604]
MSTTSFNSAFESSSRRASEYEYQIKELEAKLAEHLSNFRAIDGSLQEALTSLKRNSRRADKALDHHVPHIYRELEDSRDVLSELVERLPIIRTQVGDVRRVYDSGRQKALSLVSDLEWLNTDFQTRFRTILFSPSSAPVSWRYKVLCRLAFLAVLVTVVWASVVAIGGAYRAHRERLVWGARIMS